MYAVNKSAENVRNIAWVTLVVAIKRRFDETFIVVRPISANVVMLSLETPKLSRH